MLFYLMMIRMAIFNVVYKCFIMFHQTSKGEELQRLGQLKSSWGSWIIVLGSLECVSSPPSCWPPACALVPSFVPWSLFFSATVGLIDLWHLRRNVLKTKLLMKLGQFQCLAVGQVVFRWPFLRFAITMLLGYATFGAEAEGVILNNYDPWRGNSPFWARMGQVSWSLMASKILFWMRPRTTCWQTLRALAWALPMYSACLWCLVTWLPLFGIFRYREETGFSFGSGMFWKSARFHVGFWRSSKPPMCWGGLRALPFQLLGLYGSDATASGATYRVIPCASALAT